jgi:acetyl-CoA carboxylase biotin carboxylase subunit
MLSKLVAFAETREAAIDRILRALDEYFVGGIKTNLGLFQLILSDADFRAARIDTGYLDRLLAGEGKRSAEEDVPDDVAAVAAAMFVAAEVKPMMVRTELEEGRWAQAARREALRG